MQRGMPSESCRQQLSGLLLQLPDGRPIGSQQLFETLQAVALEPVLQSSPGFEHELPLPQRPNGSPALTFWHLRPAGLRNPQQSWSIWQSSPRGPQPEGCSQMVTPLVAPLVPHDFEQQLVLQS